jgi:hypothetical protein
MLLLATDRPGQRLGLGLVIAQFVTAVDCQAVVFGEGRLRLVACRLVAMIVFVVAANRRVYRSNDRFGAGRDHTRLLTTLIEPRPVTLHRISHPCYQRTAI